MEPLLEFRDLLAESRDNHDWREEFRRGGQDGVGPYKPKIRALLLEKLLRAQYEVTQSSPQTELITNQELVAIQVIWYRDGIFNHQVSDIYNKIYSSKTMETDKIDNQKRKELEILSNVCSKNPDHIELIGDLLNVQKTKILMRKKVGLSADIETQLERFLKNNVNTKPINDHQ
jgi:DNA sulfur modification protein DndC